MATAKRAARKTASVAIAAGVLTSTRASPQSVIDAAFSLTASLFVQSSNTSTWSRAQLQLFADERRETMTLLQRAELPESRLWIADATELQTAADQLTQAADSIRGAQSAADLGEALPMVNSAQRGLAVLGERAGISLRVPTAADEAIA